MWNVLKISLAAFCVAMACAAAAQEPPEEETASPTTVFTSERLGLQFTYPSTWQLETQTVSTDLVMTLADGTEARVEIHESSFVLSPQEWVETTRRINQDLQRTVERQWEEEILGVPMLMSRISYLEAGRPVTVVSGLIFSANPNKMLFRLKAPTTTIDEAEQNWRTVLNTLRPQEGTTLQPAPPAPEQGQNNNETQTPPPATPVTPPSRVVLSELLRTRNDEALRTQSRVDLQTLGMVGMLQFSDGWEAQVGEGVITLQHSNLRGTVNVRVAEGSEEAATREHLRRLSEDLARFSEVTLREDPMPGRNRAGADFAYTIRTGSTAEGERASVLAAGFTRNRYWLLGYEVNSLSDFNADRNLLISLMQSLTFILPEISEPVPTPDEP